MFVCYAVNLEWNLMTGASVWLISAWLISVATDMRYTFLHVVVHSSTSLTIK